MADTAYRDGQIANLAAAMIRDHSTDQPFFLAVGFWRPHLPFVAPKKYWDLHDARAIPLPSPSSAPDQVPEIAMHSSREIKGYGGSLKDRPFATEEIRHYRHGYYASISFLDAQVGEILDALENSDHADDTIIIFTSDHGFHIGEQSLWGKTSNFELDARVPLIVADPSHPVAHGKKTDSIVELLDLYPTLAALAGISNDCPGNLQGVSFAPVVRNPTITTKDIAFTQHQQPFYGSRKNWKAWGYSARIERWRYTIWRDIQSKAIIARELYDHEQDPLESKNVAANDQYADIASRLEDRIIRMFDLK